MSRKDRERLYHYAKGVGDIEHVPQPVGDIDHWPTTIDVRYDENGPALLCDGWTEGYGNYLEPCRQEMHGSNLAELRADLLDHVTGTPHYKSPYETLMERNAQ